ncbi:TRAM domain-containing protein [Halostella sp. JP-L12]|uniref:RlmE family RNA methyltransferase n=1 Tax=Halostella TaxID=1843185 RepID=UPI000EF7AAB9|nr:MULTISPECIES: 23S rRNA (uridine(2552)-2'-O)-methyltransferase [Halostella]NHN46049.1 TRAM domain-containing protein [Halostella sp. JP-L12]
MAGKDEYYNRAKQEGYRTRAAYKLKQLDELEGLIGPGNTVVDLGAAPGGWMQVAAEMAGEGGTVIGVDRQRIDPLEDDHGARVETVRGDMTEEETREEVVEIAGEADVVLSDLAPNMTGEYGLDHARSVHLARQAFETALELLDSGGDFAVKVFEGRDLDDLRDDIEEEFEYVRTTSPDASRDESSEVYLIAKGRLTAPVREGDRLTVEIVDEGSEGDGVAKVDDYTLFVREGDVGEEVEIEVTDVKPRFGFAKRVD